MAAENLEYSVVTKSITKGSTPVADLALGTLGGTLKTNGVNIEILEVVPNFLVGFNFIHDATSTTALKYAHAEITVTRGAAIDLDNVLDTVEGAVQSVKTLLIDSTPTTDTYLVIIVHLSA